MWGISMLLLRLAVAATFAVGCGSSSPSVPGDAGSSGSPGAVDPTPTLRSETGGIGQILHDAAPKEVVEGIIDSCTWEPSAAGGPVELNLSFTVVNNSKQAVWTTFRMQNSSGTMYRPAGRASEISVDVGGRESRTIHTGKFPVGAEDVELIISARQLGKVQRVLKEVVPLDQCTQR